MIRIDGVGHDGSGIGVNQNDLNAFFPQRTGGLGTCIVKFAGLTNNNGTGTNDEDGFDVWIFGHFYN